MDITEQGIHLNTKLLRNLMKFIHDEHSELQFNSIHFFDREPEDEYESCAIELPDDFNELSLGMLGEGPYYIVSYDWQMWADYPIEKRYEEIILSDMIDRVGQHGVIRYIRFKIDGHGRFTFVLNIEFDPYSSSNVINKPEYVLPGVVGHVQFHYQRNPLKKVILVETHLSATEEYFKEGTLVRRNRRARLSRREKYFNEYYLVGDKGSTDQQRGNYTLQWQSDDWELNIGSKSYHDVEVATLNGGMKVTIEKYGNIDLLNNIIGLALPSGDNENTFEPEAFFTNQFNSLMSTLKE